MQNLANSPNGSVPANIRLAASNFHVPDFAVAKLLRLALHTELSRSEGLL
jgi:hypothetical protein